MAVDFDLRFEWETGPGSRAPELNATWARLEIRAGGKVVTEVKDCRASSIRTGIYVPLFPIAEWIVANWFFLWHEWRKDAPDDRHNLKAAREGFALPDLLMRPAETKVSLSWTASSAPFSDLEFLSTGADTVSKAKVQERFAGLVHAVIARLETSPESFALASRLAADWAAIQDVLQDPEQRSFCERAARLGQDPFAIDDSAASRIEGLASLPEPLVDDFCDALHIDQVEKGAKAVTEFVNSLAGMAREGSGWKAALRAVAEVNPSTPWDEGYRSANRVRSFLGLNGGVLEDVGALFASALGSFTETDFAAPGGIECVCGACAGSDPVFGIPATLREEKRRFHSARAVGAYLASGDSALITRGSSEAQQRNRAFAAELLAPAAAIRKRIGGRFVDGEGIADLANEFRVSDYVIRHQIENHQLASIV